MAMIDDIDAGDTDALLEEFFNTTARNASLATTAINTQDTKAMYTDNEAAKIREAWALLVERSKGRRRSCGKPYYLHPLRVAVILAQLRMDGESICAALLHSAADIGIEDDELRDKFGENVLLLINGTARIKTLTMKSDTLQQADAIRKMLFAMSRDVRVILVKMADRLDRIRNIRNVEVRHQRALAAEVIDIWAPLADRLGMQAEKNEFEDLALKYTHPAAFAQIKAIVSQSLNERNEFLNQAVSQIRSATTRAGIDCVIKSRAKHFYSIYQKMRKRGKAATELFDLFAIRIICHTNAECYTLLGIIHGMWKPLDGRFKDYIAVPKANKYQSLHTTVMCEVHPAPSIHDASSTATEHPSDSVPVGKPLEIQIRTEEMDNHAEHGVASHWLYKKGSNHDMVSVDNLSIFNKLRDMQRSNLSDEDFFAKLKSDLLGDEIYVFTPKGEVIQLPEGSCAVDFAYRIHTSIGEKIVGAKADGKIIPLLQPLHNTQIIEVLTDPRAHPTQAQLSSCATSKARQKIHAWLAAHDPMFITDANAEPRCAAPDNSSGYSSTVVRNTPLATTRGAIAMHPAAAPSTDKQKTAAPPEPKVTVDGTTNVATTFAKCCHPHKGDAIVGFVSRRRNIVIHRADCLIYQRINDKEKRTVTVEWESGKE